MSVHCLYSCPDGSDELNHKNYESIILHAVAKLQCDPGITTENNFGAYLNGQWGKALFNMGFYYIFSLKKLMFKKVPKLKIEYKGRDIIANLVFLTCKYH